MGSGTTGVVAKKLGRSFVGIETDQSYFEMAARRIENAAREPDLFALNTRASVKSVFEMI